VELIFSEKKFSLQIKGNEEEFRIPPEYLYKYTPAKNISTADIFSRKKVYFCF